MRLPITRRACLALAAGLPFSAHAEEHTDGVPSLAQAAARCGLLYGSDSDSEIAREPPDYARLMRRHCALFAPMFQWRLTQPQANGPDPGWEDPNIRFARDAGMRLTGGHFIWYQSVPEWFARINDRAAAERAMTRHIAALGGAYAGQVMSWNVVNEALDPRGAGTAGLRRSVFLDRFGEAFFDIGFHAARAADPSALLAYNDYALETTSEAHAARRRALLALLDRLLARRVPIDAVGLQSHLRLDGPPFDATAYRQFLAEIASRGLRILITELDVLDRRRRDATAAQRDAEVADTYTRFLTVALEEPAVASVVTWGLSDRYTWLSPEVSPELDLPPGPPARPLPFDASFRPKPAYDAIMAAFAAAPMRKALHPG